jgi:hypothetical protein
LGIQEHRNNFVTQANKELRVSLSRCSFATIDLEVVSDALDTVLYKLWEIMCISGICNKSGPDAFEAMVRGIADQVFDWPEISSVLDDYKGLDVALYEALLLEGRKCAAIPEEIRILKKIITQFDELMLERLFEHTTHDMPYYALDALQSITHELNQFENLKSRTVCVPSYIQHHLDRLKLIKAALYTRVYPNGQANQG